MHQVFPFLYALSVMNCANVERVEHVPNRRLSRAGVRRGQPPLVKFYTLDIKPMPQPSKADGPEQPGDSKAQHLCRGHFKDYRGGRGLFGRYPGLFYWGPQVRGSAEAGEVVKDYRLGP